jgi:Zn-dependent protease with chaperone function
LQRFYPLPMLSTSIRIALLLWFSFIGTISYSQQFIPYYKTDDSVRTDNSIRQSGLRIDQILVAPESADKEFKSSLDRIKKNQKEFISYFLHHNVLCDTLIAPFVEKVFKKIQASNPSVADQRLFLTSDPSPNAASFGEGTVAFFLGLFAKLENENEIAFALCHELAHNNLNHVNNSIMSHLNLFYDKQFQKDLKKTLKSEYNIHQRLDTLFSNFSLKNLHHSRESEVQADSMGMVFFMKAGYRVQDGLRAVALLDSIDEPLYTGIIDMNAQFNCAEFPFDKSWNEYKPRKEWEAKDDRTQEMKDSLKTHPDAKKRVEYLRKYFHAENTDITGGRSKYTSSSFEPLRLQAEFELVQSWFEHEVYDESLHLALQMLAKYPQSDYLHSIVSLSLYQVYVHEKNHTMHEVVEMPDSRFPESFNRLLTLLQLLPLSDLSGLSYCHLSNYKPFNLNSQYYLAAKFASASIKNKNEEAENIKKNYLSLFPDGKFISIVNPKKEDKKQKTK